VSLTALMERVHSDGAIPPGRKSLLLMWITVDLAMMQYTVYAVFGVCCTRCMLGSVFAVLGVTFRSWLGEIEKDDITSCF